MRALTVLYNGGEISNLTLQKIQYLVNNDTTANGQGIVCVQLSNDEIAQLVAEAAANAVAKPNIQIRINRQTEEDLKNLDNALILLRNTFKTSTPDPVDVIIAYTSDVKIKNAMITIAHATDALLSKSCASNLLGRNKTNFIKMIKKLVDNV